MRAPLIRLVLGTLACLPLPLAHAIGTIVGTVLSRLPNKLRHVTRANIAVCLPGLVAEARDKLVRKSLVETGKTVTEMGAVWHWGRDRVLGLVQTVHGESHLRSAIERGRGVILAVPHLGNWEMVGLYCSAHYPMTSLYRPAHIAGLDPLVRRARQRLGAHLVPTDTSGVRALYSALERGELVGILPDQEPKRGNGIFAPFFGTPAYTMTLLARLAKRTGAAVVFACAERLPAGRGFDLHFAATPEDLAARSIEEITVSVNAGVEALIHARPAQYQWSYKRLRERPKGESGFY